MATLTNPGIDPIIFNAVARMFANPDTPTVQRVRLTHPDSRSTRDLWLVNGDLICDTLTPRTATLVLDLADVRAAGVAVEVIADPVS